MRETGVKERILDTASRLFYDQGYNVTGINQIIDEAEIARASLYNHFPSKTDLLLAYLDRTHEQWFAELDAFIGQVTGPKEKLLALFDFRRQRQQKLRYKGCHFNKINAEAGDEQEVQDRVKAHKERFRSYIQKLVKETYHRHILDDDQLTDTIFILLEGGVALGGMFRNSTDALKARQITASLL